MTTPVDLEQPVCRYTGLSNSEHVELLKGAESELRAERVPNRRRAVTQTKAKGLRLSPSLDTRLTVLTRLAKASGHLERFEKEADLIRKWINEEYIRVVGPLYGRS